MSNRLLQICMVFGSASLLSFGGGSAIVPELQLQTVHDYGWLTSRQFADSFAITQVTPGPSTLLVTLLGYRADGLAGALLATVAMIVPASVLVGVVTMLWLRTGHARWHVALERGIAPIAVGLVVASGIIIARTVDHGVSAWAVTLAAGLVLGVTKLNPLAVVCAGGVIGLLLNSV
ncbi:chromate transporter [Acidisphaera sp. L21]|jgi:chromate transporter|uniref:chromate transporter n=1 Tax=Acidisphaera sp. L21 TaxID=1641851 RepID=UPI00131C1B17|nr:chromate transporter [Acidisphaera sp. L21]